MSSPLIYVVDDDPSTARMVAVGLKKAGYRAEFFVAPTQALERITDGGPRPGLLVTDYEMPEMTGVELIQHCRAGLPGLKTIVMSGAWTGESPREPLARPNALLHKPFSHRQLLDVVTRVLADAAPSGSLLPPAPPG